MTDKTVRSFSSKGIDENEKRTITLVKKKVKIKLLRMASQFQGGILQFCTALVLLKII